MTQSAHVLFELGTEELPPVALRRLSEAFTREFVAGLKEANLVHGEVVPYAAPRRLALLVRDCALLQPDRDVEKRGPAVKAAFDADGKPTRAAEGFARSCGTTVDQLERMDTAKGEWLVYRLRESGRSASELLPAIAENALNRLPIPKRMRWGASEAQFVRPVHWLVFMHGEHIVPCSILDAEAGNTTHGHRFHHPQAITLYNPEDYAEILKDLGKVIAHFGERRDRIEAQVIKLAEELGGTADMDPELLDEVTALNEWPVPVSAGFEERFLEVPQEALVATMKTNQKYFPLFNADGNLMNRFITIANVESKRPDVIREGNERVVRPRLSDAMFFWQQDGRKRLEDHLDSLRKVVFQQKLGSMHEKSLRVSRLAGHIAGLTGADVNLAERAGLLSRCDLMTEMVYEFPSMQGIMGRYQAGRDGEEQELALAMDEFYMPRFSGDQLPQTPTGISIALAERLDTLVGIFGIGMKPSGDKDPFALRRAALGALRILSEHSLSLDLHELLQTTARGLDALIEPGTSEEVYGFMVDRLRGLLTGEQVGNDVFDAVAAVRPSTVSDFQERIEAVVNFGRLPESEALAAANKRIGNILKKVDGSIPTSVDKALFELDAETSLFHALEAVRLKTGPLVEKGDYINTLETLASLRESVDRFFDDVMVNVDDPTVRGNRLALLNAVAEQFLQVADISLLQARN